MAYRLMIFIFTIANSIQTESQVFLDLLMLIFNFLRMKFKSGLKSKYFINNTSKR